MSKIIHVVTHLGGGVGRVLTNIARQSALIGDYDHEILCLDYLSPTAKKLVKETGVVVKAEVNYEDIHNEVEEADIVQLDWWNHPLLYRFLCSAKLPAIRLLVYSHVSGYYPPFVLTREIIDFSDMFVASTPYTCDHHIIQSIPEEIKRTKIRVVFVSGGISRVAGVTPKAHRGFNVGYIGTVDFCKMHPDFVKVSSSIEIPEVTFIVCGGGMEDILRRQALELNAKERFEFMGYVEDIRPILEVLDVFGYPLCREHYGTGEQALLEAMGAGVPPVVFPHGAEKYIVENNKTGIIVDSGTEYIAAIEYLYRYPQERMRLGSNAREYATKYLGVDKTVKKFSEIYDELLAKPKRERTFKKRFLPVRHIYSCSHSMGSDVFISSLGDSAREFIVSVTSESIDELFRAEETIANCAPAMRAETRGSVFHYSRVFPDDVWLKFWAGLILQKQGKHSDAIQYFQTTYNMGYSHWRVLWYLAKSANEIEDFAIAEKALKDVIKVCPAFSAAKDMLKHIAVR